MRPLNPEPVAELERLHAETVALVRWMEKNDGLSYGAVILAMVDEAKAHREVTSLPRRNTMRFGTIAVDWRRILPLRRVNDASSLSCLTTTAVTRRRLQPNPQMQPTGRTGRRSARAPASSRPNSGSVDWCGRQHGGLQLICMSLGSSIRGRSQCGDLRNDGWPWVA
jgi:hypothetical protein